MNTNECFRSIIKRLVSIDNKTNECKYIKYIAIDLDIRRHDE